MASTHAAQIAPLTMPSTPPLEGLYGGIEGINLTAIRYHYVWCTYQFSLRYEFINGPQIVAIR